MLKIEDISAKSKNDNSDDLERTNTKASNWGILTLFIACLFFSTTKIINNGEPFFEFPAILFAYLLGMNIFKYSKMKKSIYLAGSIAFAFAFLCMTVFYFMYR